MGGRGLLPLNAIERSLSDLINARRSHPVRRTMAAVTAEDAMALLEPGDVLIDCTGSNSLLRDRLVPGSGAADGYANTFKIQLEYALVITFLYSACDCNEYCKCHKNIQNARYKFIPAVNRTYYDGSISHVTGIVNITAEDYERMPSRFDGHWLRSNFPHVAQSMDRFIAKVKQETNGELVGDLEIVRIPLDLRARSDQPAVAPSRDGRPPIRSLVGVPRRRFGDGLSVLPVDFARFRVRDVPGEAPRAGRRAGERRVRSL